MILPLCPDKGPCMTYDLTPAASTYLDGVFMGARNRVLPTGTELELSLIHI